MTKPITIRKFYEIFPDNDACLDHLVQAALRQRHGLSQVQQPDKFYRLSTEKGSGSG